MKGMMQLIGIKLVEDKVRSPRALHSREDRVPSGRPKDIDRVDAIYEQYNTIQQQQQQQ